MSQTSQTTKSGTEVACATNAAEAEVTAYTQGPAIFREKRTLKLAEGKSKVAIVGLPETFVANSLTITDVQGEGRLKLGSLSYRAASLSIEAILEQAVGTEVTLIERTNAGELKVTGKLLYVLGNQAVLESLGRLTVTPLSDRLSLDPATLAGLTTTSSLQFEPTASHAGDYAVSILFAAEGLQWTLNYEAFYDAKNEKLARFACWVNLTNKSGADIDAARIKLIFGANTGYNDDYAARKNMPRAAMAMSAAAPRGGAGGGLESLSFGADNASVESVGEQKLYTLPEPLSIAHDETKQTLLFLSENVPVTPEYFLNWTGYPLDPDGQATSRNKLLVNVRLKLANSKEGSIGLALPPGDVKVFEKDSSGSLQRTDGSRVTNHVTVGEKFELALATPCKDIKATRRLVSVEDDPIEEVPAPEPVQDQSQLHAQAAVKKPEPKPRFRREARETVIFNFKDKAVEVLVQDNVPHGAEFIEPLTDVKGFASVGGASTYKVTVPQGGQVKLTYRIKYRIN